MAVRQGTRKSRSIGGHRVTVADPLDMLMFLLPLILFYEIVCLAYPQRVIAYNIVQHFMWLFGAVGVWAPALMIPVILLATHIVSGKPWTVHWGEVGWMYVESLLCAIPLLLLNWTVPLIAPAQGISGTIAAMAQGIGAGVYEELVFRLVFISLVLVIGSDVFGGDRRIVGVVAILLSAVLFAAHHHYPIGAEAFAWVRFMFRTVAGVYLSTIFWYRGYASAAGCHAAYNAVLVLMN